MHAWSAAQSSLPTKHATVSAQQPPCMHVSHAAVGNVTPLACMLHAPPDWGVEPPSAPSPGVLFEDEEHAAPTRKAKNATVTDARPAKRIDIVRF
jgi:hypothetical protein